MNKLIIALIAGAFATVAGAQAPAAAPSMKQEATKAKAAQVDAVTKAEAPASQGTKDAAKNVAESKKEARALKGKKHKQATVDAVTKTEAPNSQGTANAAANVANSKAMGAADPAAKKVTPAEQKAMQKKSTP